VRIFVDLMRHDAQMMRVVARLERDGGCSPKKWVVVDEFKRKSVCSNADAENTFRKLVLLDVIRHSRNGHCWLTDKGAQALL
jgi:hypothetical protein